jgi:Kef-type K+ transport system membrane component KefB
VNTGKILLDILILLVAAKGAAELAERIGVPAVLGEIVAGVLIGPSVLGLVKPNDVLHVLAELGVILLLLQVGLETDLRDLGKVGRAALAVAIVGVVGPMVAGGAAASALGHPGTAALFVGAALTATSVGITARVFGDLRALATTEARIVLGAAVADDVLGLIILTVVSRIATSGSIDIAGTAGVIGIAIGFLVVSVVVGSVIAPRMFRVLANRARSSGTVFALGLAFALAFAELASAAKLAPIIGAFVAGLVLRRSEPGERIARELVPLGHVFIPVFFLQIGLDVEIDSILRPEVLGLAGVLLAIAVVTKVAAGWALRNTTTDRLLIGLGMMPRGEVGLIFAAIGQSLGILDEDLYAAILIVVLGTTMVTPPLLRWRLAAVRRRSDATPDDIEPPSGGWLAVNDAGEIDLVATPPNRAALDIALDAAVAVRLHRPGSTLLDWLAGIDELPTTWDQDARARLWTVVRLGDAKSWRFLQVTGMLRHALPELATVLDERRRDRSQLDPAGALRWPIIERLTHLIHDDDDAAVEFARLLHPERVLVAALALDAAGEGADAAVVGRALTQRLELDLDSEGAVAHLIADHALIRNAALRATPVDERQLTGISAHIPDSETLRSLRLLTLALDDFDSTDTRRIERLTERLAPIADHDPVTAQRRAAQALVDDWRAGDRIAHAPAAFVLSRDARELARQASTIDPVPARRTVRVVLAPGSDGPATVAVIARDQRGLFAAVTRALAISSLDVDSAATVTWGDGAVLDTFVVRPIRDLPTAEELERAISQQLRSRSGRRSQRLCCGTVTFDDAASPWHTICRISAANRAGLLADVAELFANHHVTVHSARVATVDGQAIDEFAITTTTGARVSADLQRKLSDAFDPTPSGSETPIRVA